MTTTFLDPSDPRAWVRLNILKSPHYADPRPEPLDACHHVFTFARRDFPLDFHIPGAEEEPISHEQAKQYAKDIVPGQKEGKMYTYFMTHQGVPFDHTGREHIGNVDNCGLVKDMDGLVKVIKIMSFGQMFLIARRVRLENRTIVAVIQRLGKESITGLINPCVLAIPFVPESEDTEETSIFGSRHAANWPRKTTLALLDRMEGDMYEILDSITDRLTDHRNEFDPKRIGLPEDKEFNKDNLRDLLGQSDNTKFGTNMYWADPSVPEFDDVRPEEGDVAIAVRSLKEAKEKFHNIPGGQECEEALERILKYEPQLPN